MGASQLAAMRDEQARAQKLWEAMVVMAPVLYSSHVWREAPLSCADGVKTISLALLNEWEMGG